jgi:peroxiredoxin
MHAKTSDKVDLSLEGSHINRNGLSVGIPAPAFELPLLNGTKLSLEDFLGQRVLLVFSDPNCGPCNALAPQLEHLYRTRSDFEILMISRGKPDDTQSKVEKYGLTFPIVLQNKWEISRKYEIFATPIAYLIDELGIVIADVAVGHDAILDLVAKKDKNMEDKIRSRIATLRQEFELGQVELEKVERQGIYLRETMLRISGAIQALEEMLPEEWPKQNLEIDHDGALAETPKAYASSLQ